MYDVIHAGCVDGSPSPQEKVSRQQGYYFSTFQGQADFDRHLRKQFDEPWQTTHVPQAMLLDHGEDLQLFGKRFLIQKIDQELINLIQGLGNA